MRRINYLYPYTLAVVAFTLSVNWGISVIRQGEKPTTELSDDLVEKVIENQLQLIRLQGDKLMELAEGRQVNYLLSVAQAVQQWEERFQKLVEEEGGAAVCREGALLVEECTGRSLELLADNQGWLKLTESELADYRTHFYGQNHDIMLQLSGMSNLTTGNKASALQRYLIALGQVIIDRVGTLNSLFCYRPMHSRGYRHFPIIQLDRCAIAAGDTLRSGITVGTYDADLDPDNVELIVGEDTLTVGPDGRAHWSVVPRQPGEHAIEVTLSVTNRLTGEVSTTHDLLKFSVW